MSDTDINGAAPQAADPSPLQIAQQRLVAAAMAQGIPPDGIANSAYINGLLQAARVTALMRRIQSLHPEIDVDLVLTQGATEAIMTEILPRLEAAKAPSIVRAGRH